MTIETDKQIPRPLGRARDDNAAPGGTRNDNRERALLGLIHRRWGALIDSTCHSSSVLPEFLAALVANESGGNPSAQAFEPRVHQHLLKVRGGDEPQYGVLTRARLSQFSDPELVEFSISWGLTQIMGYHAIDDQPMVADGRRLRFSEAPVYPKSGWCSRLLLDPAFNLEKAARLLAEFAYRNGLALWMDFEGLFRCWNTGRPDGATYDPQYVANGLRRMEIYREALHHTLQGGALG